MTIWDFLALLVMVFGVFVLVVWSLVIEFDKEDR